MLYVPKDFNKGTEVHYLVSPDRVDKDGDFEITYPSVGRPKDIIHCFVDRHDGVKMGGNIPTDIVAPSSCSLDIMSRYFKKLSGEPLSYPFVLNPQESVVGFSGVECIGSEPISFIETRSRFARKGLTCNGFWRDGSPYPIMKGGFSDLDFVFTNYSSVPLLFREPHAFAQFGRTYDSRDQIKTALPIKITRDGLDVTDECKVEIGKFTAYALTLADNMRYFREAVEPVDIQSDFSDLAVNMKLSELNHNPDFCLTVTREKVQTNGVPAYVFPVHYNDAISRAHIFYDTQELADFTKKLFDNTEFLPVTANAGIINPGTNSTVVLENITRGRKHFKDYFVPGERVAIVMPLPFFGGGTADYEGDHGDQNGICF